MSNIYRRSLRRRYLEAISSQAASLSLSNMDRFYIDYIRRNLNKVESELDRVGYFVLKNKVSIGNSSTTTKDIFITTYFVNMENPSACIRNLEQEYHGDFNIRTTNGFFVPSTNELVVIVRIYNLSNIEQSVKDSDIRSTIEHELTHAFDNTSKSDKLSKQKNVPGIGNNFLAACAYLGCASNRDLEELIIDDFVDDPDVARCLHAISVILYKLFTITEFNAHQMSDLDLTHKADINKSKEVMRALKNDVITEYSLTNRFLRDAVSVDADDAPALWRIVGNVLDYMGYKVNRNSSKAVYNFFKKTSEKLFRKYLDKKLKNQTKAVSLVREKGSIRAKLVEAIKDNTLDKGVSFWFSPSGSRDSYLCRITYKNGKVSVTVNHKPIKVYGNADGIMKRALDAYKNSEEYKYEFSLDNLVDIITQSIERNFNDVSYDPVYDITIPQDEETISKSNKISSRFADLDWD